VPELPVFTIWDGAGESSSEGAEEAVLRERPSVLILSVVSMVAGVASRELAKGPSFEAGGFFELEALAVGVDVDSAGAKVVEVPVTVLFPLLAAFSLFSLSIWRASWYVSPLSRLVLDETAFLFALL
jgi:hypothetical protein